MLNAVSLRCIIHTSPPVMYLKISSTYVSIHKGQTRRKRGLAKRGRNTTGTSQTSVTVRKTS